MVNRTAAQGRGEAVLVTGGASGLGAGAARLLAQRGRYVVVADRDVAGAQRVVADIGEAGGRARAVEVDVTDPESCERLFAHLQEDRVTLGGLVNSAGLARRAGFLDMTPEQWTAVVGTNLEGTMRISQAFARELAGRDAPGSVVNISSVMGHFAAPNLSAYASSKGGIAMLTRAMALELAPLRIRVNAVSPGYIETALTEQVFRVSRYRAAVLARTPMGRLGTPEDVARVIAFLLSDDADYVTGQILPVDGGMTAGDASLSSPGPEEVAAATQSDDAGPTGEGAASCSLHVKTPGEGTAGAAGPPDERFTLS